MLKPEISPRDGNSAFSLLFDHHPVPMWIYDLETLAFVAVNNAAIRSYGYSRDEFLSMTLRDIRPPEDVPPLLALVARPRAAWQESGQWRHLCKDGRVIDVEIVSHTLEHNGRACVLVTARDISRQKSAEAEARRYNRLYATLSQINQAIVRIKERDALFHRVCQVSVEYGQFVLAWIAGVEESGRVLPLAYAGEQAGYLARYTDHVRRLDEMRGPTAVALRERRLTLSQDIASDPRMAHVRDSALAHGLRSSASIPLQQRGAVVGALNLYAAEPSFFTEQEQALLEEIGDDISFALDSMQTEAEAAAARELFSQLFHFSPIPTALLRARDRVYMDVNQAYERLLGRERDAIVGRPSDEMILWADLEKRRKLLEQLVAGESIRDLEFDFLTASGETRAGLLYVQPVIHEGEKYFLSNILDITERKQAEARLAYQAQLLTYITDAVIASDANLAITSWNHAAEELYGWSAEEAIGRQGQELLHSEFVTLSPEEAAHTLLTTGRLDSDMIQYTKDGRRLYVESRSIALRDERGQITGFVGVNRDITERKVAEGVVRQAVQTMRLQAAALEAAANAIVITDRAGVIEWVNPAFSTLTGYSAEEAIGRTPGELLRSGRHDRQFYAELWETILAGNVWQGEIVNRRKDGTLYTEEQTITPVRDEQGQITHFVAIKQDITDRREAQIQIRRQERLAAVGHLAAGIAHDFNNIMAVIVLYAQMMARSSSLSERDRERLATIHDQAQHGAHMIQQILDFSRRAVVERHPVDLLPLLKEHVKLLQRTLPEHIEVTFETGGPGEYIVRADPTRIQQTIMNLAVNARDAMPTGGKLHIALRRIEVQPGDAPLPEMEPGSWVCLTVTDTGIGIAENVVEHIFEPFYTTKAPGEGTGLGLAQVHGIVSEHGGHISVASRPREGTTFTIYLPSLQPAAASDPALHLRTLARGHGETVLVVEDNAQVRAALVEVLAQLNYRTCEAADGIGALEFLAGAPARGAEDATANPPVDLILSDVVMPRMGGVELVRALRGRGLTTPVVLVTGHPLNTDVEGLGELGVAAWLTKPLNPEELAAALADALGKTKRPGSRTASGPV